MQPPSASPCRGGISWQGVLLAVSLLTFWNPHPTAQLTIEPVPFDAAEGRDVLLLVHNVSGNTVGVSWYRGQITDRSRLIVSYSNITHSAAQGPAFSGREIVYPNGSLLFVNLTKEDTGFYTLQTTTAIFDTEAATGEIRVHEKLPKPNITINNSQPMEGEDSLALTCEPEISYATYLWKINSQRIPDGDRLKLSNNNRTLTLFSVTRNDTGPYECETQNPVSASRSDPLTLNISYGPDAPIINPPDSHIRPGTNLNLSCHADSNPPAQFSWSFNGRPLESTQELSIPNLSTNNSGSYVCVAHNSVTNLNRTTTKNITISGLVAQPSLRATNTEPHSVAMTCFSDDPGISITWILNSQTLQLTDRMQLSPDHRTLSIDPVRQEDAGEYQCEASNPASSTRSDRYRLAVICEWPPTPGLLVGAVAGIVTGVLVGVLVAALGCFLLHTRTGRYPGFPHLMPPQVTPGLRDGGPSSDSGLTPTSPLPRDPPLSPSLPPSITSCWPWADCSTAASSAHWSPGPVPTALVSLPRLVFNTAPPAVFAPHQERAEAMCMRGPVPGHSGQGLGPGEEGGSTLHTSCVAQGP
uniref:Ig-like domain-containing protein n=1 Tax=Spermophilus dauricus TaxID=99837 RepID=A0A8C9UWZ3_SPEDA